MLRFYLFIEIKDVCVCNLGKNVHKRVMKTCSDEFSLSQRDYEAAQRHQELQEAMKYVYRKLSWNIISLTVFGHVDKS